MANRFLSNLRINDAYTLPASDGTTGQVIVTDGAGNLSFGDSSAGGTDAAAVIKRDNFTGDGTTVVFTLANVLSDEDQSQVYIDGVYQSKDTYEVSGNVLTFATAPETGHSVEVISIYGINTGPTVLYQDNFTGNGVATDFTLAQTVDEEIKTFVFLNGVYQFKGTYSIDGTTVSFDTAPANGVSIEIITIASAASETFNQTLLFYGKATEAISKGDAIMFAGVEGDHFLLAKATQAALAANHEYFLGLATQSLSTGEFGYVTEFGRLDGLDTTVWTAGDILWFDSEGATAGALTNVEPTPPNTKIQIAAVIREHQNEGVLFIRPTIYHNLSELHDVNITSIADKDMLVWNNTNEYWENTKTIGDITTGNITTSGTVDGVDISDFKSAYDSHNHDDRYYTETEIDTFLTNSTNWDTAYSWGNHATAGYLTSFTESDPTVPSHVKSITTTNVSNWNTAYGWGNHASAGYLTSFTESDPTVPSHVKSITTTNVSNWNTAYGWGDHASAGYLTSYSETDTLATVTGRGNSTTSIINGVDIRSQGQIRATGWYNTNSGTHTGLGTEIGVSGGQSYILSYNRGTSSYGILNLNATQVNTDNSFRAPIFYDSNNTGYYVNPASTSNLNAVGGVRFYASYDAGVAGSMSCDNWFRSSGATGWYNGSYGGGIHMTDSTWVRVYNNKQFYVSSTSSEAIATAGDVVALYSDMRLKTKVGEIENAVDKVLKLSGFYYKENEKAKELGYNNNDVQIGVSAQEVKEVVPEAIRRAPVDVETLEDGAQVSKTGENYLTVKYERLVPLLIEAIKEQQKQIDELKKLNK